VKTQPFKRVSTVGGVPKSERPQKKRDGKVVVLCSSSIEILDRPLEHWHGLGAGIGAFPELAPLYVGVTQAALDVQWTHDSWLLKAEAPGRDDEREHSFASVVSFEYTYYGVFGSAIDLGLLGEYLFDDRGDRTITVFDDDVFFGVRVTPNDIAGTDLLIGTSIDVDNGTTFGTLEGSRCCGTDWAASLEARLLANVERSDPLFGFENDSYLRLVIKRFF